MSKPRDFKRPLGIAMALAILAAIGAVFSIRGMPAGAQLVNAPPKAVRVEVAAVLRREVSVWSEFSGRVEARERVEIRSRVAGQVRSVHFVEGALVRAGDLLLSIDPGPYRAEVNRAKAQVLAARARANYSRTESERAAHLWKEQAIARRELDERANAADEAQALLLAAQAALQAARLNLGFTQIKAPVAGRVGRLDVTQGNLVDAGPGAPVLTTLVSVSPVRVSFNADERTVFEALAGLPGKRGELGLIPVQVGTSATAGTPFTGRLQLIDNQVDARSGTVRLRAELDDKDGALMPGQFARVRLGLAARQPAVLVSERAIGVDQDKRFVLVVNEDDTLTYREVHLGGNADGLRIVSSGLREGERIVVNGLHLVRPGARIAPQLVPMEALPS